MFWKKIIVILVLVIFHFSCKEKPKSNIVKPIVKAPVVNILDAFKAFDSSFINGVNNFFGTGFSGTVLIYKKGQLFSKAYGFRDKDEVDKMQVGDLFQLASVSKTVTATAIMILEKRGKLHLDSNVSVYLKDFPYKNVSVRHLLNHRSGLANYMYYTDTFWKDTSKIMNNGDFYQFIKDCHPEPYLNPDKSFSYCNTNFALLAVIVEQISGKAFHQFVEHEIFDVAGMKSSFFVGHKRKSNKNFITTGRYEQYEYTHSHYLDGVLGDKSLYSNVEDMFLFYKALSSEKLIKKEQLARMSEPSYKFNVYGGSYGLGFRLYNSNACQWTYHNGWWRGYWTSFWNQFEEDICYVVLTNNRRSSHIDRHGLCTYILENGAISEESKKDEIVNNSEKE